MQLTDFRQVIREIEKEVGTEDYELAVRTVSGDTVSGGWCWLGNGNPPHRVIVIGHGDVLVYVDLQSVEQVWKPSR